MLAAALFGFAAGAYARGAAEAAPAMEVSDFVEAEGSAPAEAQMSFVAEPVIQPLPAPETRSSSPGLAMPPELASAASLADLVGAIDGSAPLAADLECLAQTVYFEARGEPLDGQLAVAQVLVNRVASGQFPDDYCAVAMQPGQFSFARSGRIPAPDAHSIAWQRAVAIARIAHGKWWHSKVGDALYFHAAHLRPRWTRNLQARAMIDRHIFYR